MDQTFKIELTVNQVNVVMTALSKQPIEFAIEAFSSIQNQIAKQTQQASAPQDVMQ